MRIPDYVFKGWTIDGIPATSYIVTKNVDYDAFFKYEFNSGYIRPLDWFLLDPDKKDQINVVG